MIPNGATHTDNDGAYWRDNDGYWYYWDEIFEWCGYIGPVNQMFLNNKNPIGVK